MDFLMKVKLFLYGLSFVQIFILGYIGRADDVNIQVAYIVAGLLLLNIVVYAIIRFFYKRKERKNNGVK